MLRTERINLVATPYERETLERAAREHGMTLSNYLRMAGFRMAKMILAETQKEKENGRAIPA